MPLDFKSPLIVIMDSLMQEKTGKSSSVNSESKLSTTMIPENYQWIVEAAYYKALEPLAKLPTKKCGKLFSAPEKPFFEQG
jgi:hypothetical protein